MQAYLEVKLGLYLLENEAVKLLASDCRQETSKSEFLQSEN